jgi:hypothetical protein
MMRNKPYKPFELIHKGGNLVNHKEGGVGYNWCSTDLPLFNAIVKGEFLNTHKSRNAVLSFFSANTNRLLSMRIIEFPSFNV